MSYVAISGQVKEKLVSEAREHSDEQVVGVLLGGQTGSAIVIDDAATGPAESNSTRATLTGDSIAKIADDIISKRIRGSIVGWYHSHVRGGVFMSETDVETQLKLQQFSPMVTAMVIDAQTGSSGFFRVDPKTKEAMSVRAETPVEAGTLPPAPQPSRAVYPQAPAPAPQLSTRTILLAVLFITLAVTAGIIALIYYRAPGVYGGGTFAITNVAITPAQPPYLIASAITFDANVTGSNLKNVTLTYRILERVPGAQGFTLGDLVSVPMLLKAAGGNTYSYTIPASEISGVNLRYAISAFDTSGNVVRTNTFDLVIGDFGWDSEKTDEFIAVRTLTSQVALTLDSINGFNKPVTITVAGSPPAGVSVRPLTSQVVPSGQAVLQISSTQDSELVQKYPMEIDAVYSPPGLSAVQIIRRTTLVLTVTDFDVSVSPTYQKVTVPTYVTVSYNATYTLTMNIYHGFTVPSGFQISVAGLPAYTSWELVQVDYKINAAQTAQITYDLVIIVAPRVTTGLYLFSVNITAPTTGGTISHSVTSIQVDIET